jgi:uncharacterized SAM-binding protein YcdF (DUF218 family)
MSNNSHYEEMFDYLSAPYAPEVTEPVVVFGRQDPRVAHAAGDLVVANLAEVMVITGGIGKDSGNLLQQGYRSEAHYLDTALAADLDSRLPEGARRPTVITEEKASNGGENARHSLTILDERGFSLNSLTSVTHATSTRRLGETLRHEANKMTGGDVTVHRVADKYHFDPTNPKDQEEAAAELLRLADWPKKGLLPEQPDLPQNLVDFATDVHGKAPAPIKGWQANVLRILPPRARLGVISFAAKHGRK